MNLQAGHPEVIASGLGQIIHIARQASHKSTVKCGEWMCGMTQLRTTSWKAFLVGPLWRVLPETAAWTEGILTSMSVASSVKSN